MIGTARGCGRAAAGFSASGLSTLFFTEMWERFSYYGMRADPGYYLYFGRRGCLNWNHRAVPGGDLRCLRLHVGHRRAGSPTGSSVRSTVLGRLHHHVRPHLPGAARRNGQRDRRLVFLVIGTGLLKPNISGIVGGLYASTTMPGMVSIFYMGINIGGLPAPLVCGCWRKGQLAPRLRRRGPSARRSAHQYHRSRNWLLGLKSVTRRRRRGSPGCWVASSLAVVFLRWPRWASSASSARRVGEPDQLHSLRRSSTSR